MKKQQKWVILRKPADYQRLSEKFQVDPLIIRLMVNRGVSEEEMEGYLHPTPEDFHDAHLLHDGEKAAKMIVEAARDGKKIRVIGDYDIDGIMSTYILHSAFLQIGADASWSIPHRIRDGYGLNERLVEEAAEDGVQLIVTCDNGIAAREAIQRGKELGLQVIVTDHHMIPYEEMDGEVRELLPPADAIVNPHLKDCAYPYKDLCGAAVAWKVTSLLFQEAGLSKEKSNQFLENAAFATIGDVMPLTGENRSIVKLGLKALQQTENLGMNALLEATNTLPEQIDSFRIGFVLGPCLNASGRIASAAIGVDLLEASDPAEAKQLAARLHELNEERRDMTHVGTEQAKAMCQEDAFSEDKVLLLYLPDLSESVAGIVAGRIREATGRPSIILTDSASDPTMVKGSGRSIEAYPMYDRLHEVENLLDHYGGHPMAAGLSLLRENIEPLRRALNEKSRLTEEDLIEKKKIDADMPLRYLQTHPNLLEELALLEPFGNHNDKPTFAESKLKVVKMQQIGSEKQYLKFVLEGKEHAKMDALYFQDGPALLQDLRETYGEEQVEKALLGRRSDMEITFAYYPSLNVFRGVTSIQIHVTDYLL